MDRCQNLSTRRNSKPGPPATKPVDAHRETTVGDLKKIVVRLMKVGGFALDFGHAHSLYYKDSEMQDSCTICDAGVADNTAVVVMPRKTDADAPDDELLADVSLRLQEGLSRTLSAHAEHIIDEVGKSIGKLQATLRETVDATCPPAVAEDEITATSLEELYMSINQEESQVFHDAADTAGADAVGNPQNLPSPASGAMKESLLVIGAPLQGEDGSSTKPKETSPATYCNADERLEVAASSMPITNITIEENHTPVNAPSVDEELNNSAEVYLEPSVVEAFAGTNVVLAIKEPKEASDDSIVYSEDSVKIGIEPTFTIGQGGALEETDDLQSVDISNQDYQETLLVSERALPKSNARKKKSVFKRFFRCRKVKL